MNVRTNEQKDVSVSNTSATVDNTEISIRGERLHMMKLHWTSPYQCQYATIPAKPTYKTNYATCLEGEVFGSMGYFMAARYRWIIKNSYPS